MENQTKKLRLEDIKVESFVMSTDGNPATIKGAAVVNCTQPDRWMFTKTPSLCVVYCSCDTACGTWRPSDC